ncbi:hypothetical protein PIROE2DRAFT_9988 [Piromyces sp. E2]|nr:hypothetical protein PIROE2DRAFT_9988 [Piromyces sp. E2]|eukprot:OUM63445.1 hypothetical protein PIROE2DRAFT_9988 [Piromyces sp. E2]
MTKEEVLRISPREYDDKTADQCPDFSNGDFKVRCGFEFFCKDDKNCSSAVRRNNTAFVEFPDEYGNMKSYIADVCKPDKECNTVQCQSNSDCLSNKCMNNYCVSNDLIKIEKCEDLFERLEYVHSSRTYMHCGNGEGYACGNDPECSSYKCRTNICRLQNRNRKNVPFYKTVIYIIGSVLLFITVFCALFYYRRRCYRKNKNSNI